MYKENEYLVRLKESVFKNYEIVIQSIIPAERGFYGETWKLVTKNRAYFVKIDYLKRHQVLFKNSLEVIDYLCQNGIDYINKLIKTKEGQFSISFNGGVLAIFEWIDAKNTETDETKAFEYQLLSQIYLLTKPGFDIPKENFSSDIVLRYTDIYQQIPVGDVLTLLENNQETLAHHKHRLLYFSKICQQDQAPLYFTHGDAGGNFLIGDKNYLVDFDEVCYAPLEKDAWVMGCYEWARKLFNETLKRNGIDYTLSLERLAYYCYHMYFFYLCEMLESYIIDGKSEKVMVYFEESWLDVRIEFANTVHS